MKLTPAQLTRFSIDRLMMILCPAMVLLGSIIPLWTGTLDLVRYYAVYTFVVQLLLLYIPTHRFISRRGGARAFGLVKIGAWECIWAIFLGLGMFFLVNALAGGLQLCFKALGAKHLAVGAPMYTDLDWRLFAVALLVGCIPAYVEEALFRGALLFSWLPGGRRRALLHSAALFALVYLNPIALPALFLLGLVLALVADWSRSIVPAALVHGANTLFAMAFSYATAHISPESQAVLERMPAVPYLLFIGLLGLVLGGIGLLAFRRAARKGLAAREAAANMETKEPAADTTPVKVDISIGNATPLQAPALTQRLMKLPVRLTYGFLIAINILQTLFIFSDAAL